MEKPNGLKVIHYQKIGGLQNVFLTVDKYGSAYIGGSVRD